MRIKPQRHKKLLFDGKTVESPVEFILQYWDKTARKRRYVRLPSYTPARHQNKRVVMRSAKELRAAAISLYNGIVAKIRSAAADSPELQHTIEEKFGPNFWEELLTPIYKLVDVPRGSCVVWRKDHYTVLGGIKAVLPGAKARRVHGTAAQADPQHGSRSGDLTWDYKWSLGMLSREEAKPPEKKFSLWNPANRIMRKGRTK